MVIPALVIKLHELDPPFYQPARQQAVGGVGARDFRLFAVQIKDVIRLTVQVHGFGDGGLQPIRHFVLRNPGADFGIHDTGLLLFMHLAQVIQHSPPAGRFDARRVVQVQDGVLARPELHALVQGGQKPVAPQPGIQGLPAVPMAPGQ